MTELDVKLLIDGTWRDARSGRRLDVTNPATGEVIGTSSHAGIDDLDEALDAAARGFATWRATSAFDRAKILRAGAGLLRERLEDVARLMTAEQGKPIAEARLEINAGVETLEWFAEEARRAYGRVIPARAAGVRQLVLKEPVGPVAAFTPWNFPINQVVRKLGAALAAGCSIIVKGPEETPGSPAELLRALQDAGLPAGVANLVYGSPAEISSYLIPHPVIRKISFTGSVPVGKQLAALAGQHMKRVTMELGGHAPVVILDDADLEQAARIMVATKRRNAGQVCISPTRFIVDAKVHDAFLDRYVPLMRATRVGNGLEAGTEMGPLISDRRLQAITDLVADATAKGATVETGGARIGNAGTFFAPTVLTGVTSDMRAMNEEPFGPVSLVTKVGGLDEAIDEANRLPYGLAAYAFARSAFHVGELGERIESGMITINHSGFSLAETPFGGIKDSGYGSEGGSEAIEAYLTPKFVTERRS